MHLKKIVSFFLLFCIFLSAHEEKQNNAIYLLKQEVQLQEGQLTAALRLFIPEGYHAYWKNPGGIGFPPSIEWQEGVVAAETLWPYPERFESPLGVAYGYSGELWLFTPLKTTQTPTTAHVKWLICSEEQCLPQEMDVQVHMLSSDDPLVQEWKERLRRLPIASVPFSLKAIEGGFLLHLPKESIVDLYFAPFEGEGSEQKFSLVEEGVFLPAEGEGVIVMEDHEGKQAFEYRHASKEIAFNDAAAHSLSLIEQEGFYFTLFLTMAAAFAGGILLNFMPCVLPVVTLKIFSFVKMAGHQRKVILHHSLLFTGGVLISFWLLASLLMIFRAYGQSIGWGFQLQEPLFVAGLTAVLVVFSFSLFGLFEFGTSVASWAGEKENKTSAWGSFLSGVLATVVATPCTGPFLGTALGLALTLPPLFSLSIFTALGLGLSFPYWMAALCPAFLKWLPKPGGWMVTFKEILGFCLLATALWLLWVFGSLTSYSSLFLMLSGLFVVVMSCWVYGKWSLPHRKRLVRRVGVAMATLLLLSGFYVIIQAARVEEEPLKEQHIAWEPYDPDRLETLRAQNVPVFVDFTAKWCLICQANHATLSTEAVEKVFQKQGVVKMKADWTRKNPVVTKALAQQGRSSVPLYLLYSGQDDPFVFSQVLTPDSVIEQLQLLSDD